MTRLAIDDIKAIGIAKKEIVFPLGKGCKLSINTIFIKFPTGF